MRIDLKKGSGAAWVGTMFILLVFLMGILLMDHFNWYDAMIETQTKTDAMADAMGVSVNDNSGVPNVAEMTRTKYQMLGRMNQNSFTKIVDIDYDREQLYGIDGGDKLLVLTVKTRTPFFNASYYRRSVVDTGLDYFYFTGRNTTRIMVDPNSVRNSRFPDDITYASDPIYTNESASFPLDPDDYRDIVVQFEVDRAQRYQPMGSESREDVYLWDVTRALGCELPFYFRTNDGKPWNIYEDGHILETGTSRYTLQNIREANGYINMLRAYIPDLKDYYNRGSAVCPHPWDKYSNWKLLAHTNDIWTLRMIQAKANQGYPTVLLFENGAIWIVIPEVDNSDSSRGLFVSYATNVPEYVTEVFASNVYVNNAVAGYRVPTGNFIALTYQE